MRRICAALIALTLLAAPATSQAENGPISQGQLETMFANMRAGAPWNVDGPLLWGYFFTSPDKSSLETASKALIGEGYRFVDIHLGDKERPTDPDIWWLHVERVELHTVESLNVRNAQFYAFAAKLRRVRYDGMDVGPPS